MQKGFDEAAMVDAKAATGNIFGTLIHFLLCKDFDYYAERAFLKEMKGFEDYLVNKKIQGDFIIGNKISLLDCSITPQLYIMDIALKHYYPNSHDKVSAQFPHVLKYMNHMYNTAAFKTTKYPSETMIHGWTVARSQSSSKACGV